VSHVRAVASHVTEDSGELAWLLGTAGDYLQGRAALADVVPLYDRTRAIFERLAQADPGNAGWQRDLSVSHEKIGDVLVAQGNLAPALESYRASLAIRERLAQADPGNAGWQRDLIVSNVKLAEVAGKAGEVAEARRRYQAALSVATGLQASGGLAPRDAWMIGELETRLAALPPDTAGT
jgi:tetratricopeptide (TPR) repeat protein